MEASSSVLWGPERTEKEKENQKKEIIWASGWAERWDERVNGCCY